MVNGVIYLVSDNNQILRSRKYDGVNERRKIIERWRKFYGKRFNKCFIHFVPEVNAGAVREDGMNMRFKKDKSLAKNGVATMRSPKNLPEHKIDKRATTDPYVNHWRKSGTFFGTKKYI